MAKTLHPQYEIDKDGDDVTDYIRFDRVAGTCLCGCGQATHKDSRFRQGHDQRYRGMLLFAFRNGMEIGVVDGGMLIHSDAETLAKNDGVDMGKVSFTPSTKRPKAAKAAKPSEQALAAVEQDEQDNNEFPLGQTVKVKVGRWEYKATIASYSLDLNQFSLDFTTKAGKTATVTKPASEILEQLG